LAVQLAAVPVQIVVLAAFVPAHRRDVELPEAVPDGVSLPVNEYEVLTFVAGPP
jgi:hypothetical protein